MSSSEVLARNQFHQAGFTGANRAAGENNLDIDFQFSVIFVTVSCLWMRLCLVFKAKLTRYLAV